MYQIKKNAGNAKKGLIKVRVRVSGRVSSKRVVGIVMVPIPIFLARHAWFFFFFLFVFLFKQKPDVSQSSFFLTLVFAFLWKYKNDCLLGEGQLDLL